MSELPKDLVQWTPPHPQAVSLWVVLRWRTDDPISLPAIVAGPYRVLQEAEAAARAAMTTRGHMISLATLNLQTPA